MIYKQVPKLPEFWRFFEGNPIKSISFEYREEDYVTFIHKYIVFRNEPDAIYTFFEVEGSNARWYEEPVEVIKKKLPPHLHDRITYFYTLDGTAIILKGDLSLFPLDKLNQYFDIDVLASDKLGLYPSFLDAHRKRVVDYLNKYSYKV